jgi:uncharacterized membrane protein
MNKLLGFIRITLAGGILFLIPLVVMGIVIGKVFGFLKRFSTPIAKRLPYADIAGAAIATLITIVFLLILCFAAGIFMRTKYARKMIQWLENYVLVYIPGYSYIQALSTNRLSKEGTINWKPASILVDDNEVICFVIDETENYCSIFLPSAPSPSTGSICVREKKLVKFLPISMPEAIIMIRQFGKGAASKFENLL